MGDPVTMGITAVVGTAASLFQQSANSKAMAEAQKKQNEMITKATIENYQELGTAERAIAYNTGQDAIANQIAKLDAIGQAEAMASATGARGGSVEMAFMNINQQADRAASGLNMARDDAMAQINTQAKALQQGAEMSYDNSIIQKPSIVSAIGDGMKLGNQVTGFVGDFKNTYRDYKPVK